MIHRFSACVILAFLLCGCSSVPEEPAGEPVALQPSEVANDVPAEMSLYFAWHRRGDRFVDEGRTRSALFCYHQAEESFPKSRPEFAAGSHWKERDWSGFPVVTYLAKAKAYYELQRFDLSKYYLDLAQDNLEHPYDEVLHRRVSAGLAYAQKDFEKVTSLLESSSEPMDLFFAAVSQNAQKKVKSSPSIEKYRRKLTILPDSEVRTKRWLPKTVQMEMIP